MLTGQPADSMNMGTRPNEAERTMNMLLLGLNILLIMGAWHFVMKKTLLDRTRDRLFDLRDELRQVHIEQNWTMDTNAYSSLRAMINACLRYTENYSVWGVIWLQTNLSRRSKELNQALIRLMDEEFKALTPQQQRYVADVRQRACLTLIDFAIHNSGLLALMTILAMPFVLIRILKEHFLNGMSTLGIFIQSCDVWKQSTRWVASKFIDPQSFDVALNSGCTSLAK